MGNLILLEIIISLIFIYLIYSLLTTTLMEVIASVFRLRAVNLWLTIRSLFEKDPVWLTGFYRHPVIKSMKTSWFFTFLPPSNIKPEDFADAVVDIVTSGPGDAYDNIEDKLDQQDSSVHKKLRSIYKSSGHDLVVFRSRLVDFYNGVMDRAIGQYKRLTSSITLIIGFLIAWSFNVNSIQIFHTLKENSAKRAAMMAIVDNYQAEVFEDKDSFEIAVSQLKDSIRDASTKINSTLALERIDKINKAELKKNKPLLGWFLTAIALSFGAPFWFDLLNKFMKLRSSLPIATTTKENEKSRKNTRDNQTDVEG